MASTVFHGNPASQVRETGDVRSEFEALLSGCGFYDPVSSRVKIALYWRRSGALAERHGH